MSDPILTPPAPTPVTIALADILNATEVLQQKEAADKSALESIGSVTFETLRTKLIQWGVAGFPNAYTIMTVPIQPPAVCSDGVTRSSLAEYVEFCSGKTIEQHVALLQEKLTDIAASFANVGGAIAVVISKV